MLLFLDGRLERVELMLLLLDEVLERVEDPRRDLLPGKVRRREEQGWNLEEELASCRGELLGCRGGLHAPEQGKIQ